MAHDSDQHDRSGPQQPPGPLAGLRVLEAGNQLTSYCGKLFAELGADVVLIEPPGGSALRSTPSGDQGLGSPSFRFFYQNTSKRSIVVDLRHPEGVAVVKEMILGADLLLEDSSPGILNDIGIGAEASIALHPRLVYTSITPFGQTGPYASYQYTDLICMAFGGMLWMGGYADDVPVQAAGEQAYMAGSLYGAVASMIALTHAELHGEGQHVDVSVQEAVTMGLENAAQFYDLNRHIRTRFGGGQREAGFGVFPCADGYVFLLAAGIGGNRFWPNMVKWLLAEGVANADELAAPSWGSPEFMKSDAAKQRFSEIFTPYSRTRTKSELYHASQSWRVPLGPVNNPSDIYRSDQLRSRGYFVDVDWFGRTVELPGAPYGLSATPWALTGPPPQPGADTDDVLADFGFSRDAIVQARSSGALG